MAIKRVIFECEVCNKSYEKKCEALFCEEGHREHKRLTEAAKAFNEKYPSAQDERTQRGYEHFCSFCHTFLGLYAIEESHHNGDEYEGRLLEQAEREQKLFGRPCCSKCFCDMKEVLIKEANILGFDITSGQAYGYGAYNSYFDGKAVDFSICVADGI